MPKITKKIISLNPLARILVLLTVYASVCVASFLLSYLIRFDFSIPVEHTARWAHLILLVIILQLSSLFYLGQFRSLLTYFSLPDLKRLTVSLSIPAVMLILIKQIITSNNVPPKSIIVLDAIFCLIIISGIRIGLRVFREKQFWDNSDQKPKKRVAIVGAGTSGARLQSEIRANPGLGMKVLCYLDDDSRKIGTLLHSVPVIGRPDNISFIARDLQINKVIIAMPNAPSSRIREIVTILNKEGIDHDILPTFSQSLKAGLSVLSLRQVQIEDLLGRGVVKLDVENIMTLVRDKTLLVTGAGGSIGSELCRQIAFYNPRKIILLDRSEAALFIIEQELLKTYSAENILAFPADINDSARIEELIKKHAPQIIFHAAAHKHVPMMEAHPAEAVSNNVLGTIKLAKLSLKYQIDRFILISSDKAVRPTNVMGATKRLAEIYIQKIQCEPNCSTKFLTVRFGNVLGSSGSVIPIFQKQIAQGGPVTVTHAEVRRYFMTIPEAVGLVLQCAAEGNWGDIFVLDMGEPIKIVEVARQLIELSGLRLDQDIKIQFTGLRPGEKMFEEVIYENEKLSPTHHLKIKRLSVINTNFPDIEAKWLEIEDSIMEMNPTIIKKWIQCLLPEYTFEKIKQI